MLYVDQNNMGGFFLGVLWFQIDGGVKDVFAIVLGSNFCKLFFLHRSRF